MPPKPIVLPKPPKRKHNKDNAVEVRQKKKLPKRYSSKVPKLNPETGKSMDDDDGEPAFVEGRNGESTPATSTHIRQTGRRRVPRRTKS